MEKIQKNFSLLYLLKFQSEKVFDFTFSLKRSLQKSNETMNLIFGVGHETYELLVKKNQEFFEKK